MEFKINHIYGNQEDFDLQIVKLTLNNDLSDNKPLENGWLIYNSQWYACRSSRINTEQFNTPPKQIKGYRFEYKDTFTLDDDVARVYDTYTKLKEFKQKYSIDGDLDRSSGLFVYKNDVLVAFTKFIKYNNALESQVTAWDYSEPRASIGKRIVAYEVDVAKKLGYKYLYIGPVYGLGGKYKSDFNGFEWWTGSEWSTDKDQLLNILIRDSNISTLKDLNDTFVQTTSDAK